jgi:hypothetical protein
VEAPAYDEAIHDQIKEVQSKKTQRTLNETLRSGETWEIK